MASQSAPLLTVGEQGETVFDHEDGSQVEDMKQDPQCYSNARKRTIYRPTLLIFVMLILVFAYFLTYASYRPTMIFYESTTTSFLSSSDLNNSKLYNINVIPPKPNLKFQIKSMIKGYLVSRLGLYR